MITSRLIALAIGLALAADATLASEGNARPAWAVTGFGGVTLDNDWHDVFLDPGRLRFQESYLAGAALSRRVAEPIPGLTLEVEGQLVRHFGDQDHWEVNAPILTARWGRFPWTETVDTTVAFVLGLSVASEVPAQEIENDGDSEEVMAYWMIELDTRLPAENWRLLGRLHHRSPAFGTFSEEGGANALVLGLRRQF